MTMHQVQKAQSTLPVILCDIEGTLYGGDGTVPGAVEAIAELRAIGCPLRFLSNIDSRTEGDVLGRLRARGFDIRDGELFLPTTAAREYFARRPGAAVLTVATEAVRGEFLPIQDGQEVTHVLVGDCRDVLNYPMLDEAFRALEAGAVLLALQKGRYLIAEDGPHLDTGAIVAALEYASGQSALVLGKPSPEFGELAVASFGHSSGELPVDAIWVVGDDATSDIALGQRMGATTVQVRTGKFAGQATERVFHPASHQLDSITDLPALVRTHRAARIATV
ncbi:HAD-IIA family hydrolase [Homoserinimonas sp. A447]